MRVRSAIKALGQKVGVDIRSWSERIGCERYAEHAMVRLLEAPKVKTVFDVGANIGQSVEEYVRLFPGATVWSFEPFPEACAKLRRRFGNHPRVRIEEIALSHIGGTAILRSNQSDATNSLLATDTRGAAEAGLVERMKTVAGVEVKTETLDGFCAAKGVEMIDLLKIDVQGAADLVLEGGARMIGAGMVRMVYVEVEFFAMYEGQKCFTDVARMLEGAGMVLYRLYNLHNPRGRLAWGDALFVRPELLARHLPEL